MSKAKDSYGVVKHNEIRTQPCDFDILLDDVIFLSLSLAFYHTRIPYDTPLQSGCLIALYAIPLSIPCCVHTDFASK